MNSSILPCNLYGGVIIEVSNAVLTSSLVGKFFYYLLVYGPNEKVFSNSIAFVITYC